MRRIICFALFGLLVSSDAIFAQAPHWIRPPGKVIFVGPRFRSHPGIFHRSHYFDPFRYFVQDFATPYTAPESIVPFSPTYFFLPSESSSHPQLILKDGTTYTVADYWRVDDQLHFVTSEEGGTKSVPHTAPFGDLDVQRTTDAATAQGFRFVLRDEPIEQWLQHHAKPTTSKHRSRQRSD
ncbi:MAG TPA: hypothetical protein VH188_03970 [Chthoniobacterales bacterium]|jgi:hypothetical protein|nr:hypothetical protein [Chthoniobacterales bacterium]